MCRIAVVCFVCCLVMAPLTLGQQGRKAELEDNGIYAHITVAKDELRRSKGAHTESAWGLQHTPKGTVIVHETKGRPGIGWYLAYDPEGKDPRVKLVPKLGPGCYWTWIEQEKVSQPTGFYRPCAARPAHGRMKGWALIFDRKGHLTLKKGAEDLYIITNTSIFYREYFINDPDKIGK
jgi:hypothetical protein